MRVTARRDRPISRWISWVRPPTRLTPHFLVHAEGSVLVEAGKTKVICTASVEDRVPPFLRNTGKGWVTAEYGMLPRATSTRTTREASTGKVGGRTQEIQRLIGRSLRAVTNLTALGERSVAILAYVTHGPSRPAGLRSRQRMLRMPLRSSEKVSTRPAMPAPITTTSDTGAPLECTAGTTQFGGG